MNRKILHTPDGVRDIYDEECRRKLSLERGIGQVLNAYGCRDIETPTFEFFDVFGSQVGTIPSRELYQFFDREGNTLVLRPDFTPSIARAASRYFRDRGEPVRLCYRGNTFVNHSSYQGRLKETTQMGAELVGDAGAEADAEALAMVIDSLRSTGLREFQISVGHVQYLRALLDQTGLDENQAKEVETLIRNKNSFGVKKLLTEASIPSGLTETLTRLPMLNGGEEILKAAAEYAKGTKALLAVDRLSQVLSILKIYGLERYISIDLGMISAYMYYTGIIFRGYTYGTGEAVVKGGRYDQLLAHFGWDAPSIGFVVVMDQLMNALTRQDVSPEKEKGLLRILYLRQDLEQAIRQAQALRRSGTYAELMQTPDKAVADRWEREAAEMGMEVLRIGELA